MAFVSLSRRNSRSLADISAGMVTTRPGGTALLVVYFSREIMERHDLHAMRSVCAAIGMGPDEGMLRLSFSRDGEVEDSDRFIINRNPRGGKSARVRMCAVPALGRNPRETQACEKISFRDGEMVLRLPRAWFCGEIAASETSAPPRGRGWDSEPIVDAPKPPSVSARGFAPPAEIPAAVKPVEPSPPPPPPPSPPTRAPSPKDSIAALKRAAAEERGSPEVYNINDVGIVQDRNIATISYGGRQVEIAPRGGSLVYLLARVLGEIVDANFLAKEIYGASTPDSLMKLRVLAGDVKSLVHRVGLDVIYQKPVGYRLKRSA